jgi:hypothetical protein
LPTLLVLVAVVSSTQNEDDIHIANTVRIAEEETAETVNGFDAVSTAPATSNGCTAPCISRASAELIHI